MIYVTSGFEHGIGLEVFLKAISHVEPSYLKKFHLFCSQKQLLETIEISNLPISVVNQTVLINNQNLVTTFLDEVSDLPLSTKTLEYSLTQMKPQDILLTLPTKKDQLIFNGKSKKGYTEYLRDKFNISSLTMNFLSPTDNVLLLTDHIPLSLVESTITQSLIIDKVKTTLDNFPKNRTIKEVFFSGINPHCGEEGMMGQADKTLLDAMPALRSLYPNVSFYDPKAGDTLYFSHKNETQLFVFAFHDQGLAPFKQKNGLIGINLTLGLPFKRISVDHGTAPDIFGKDCADFEGMLYLLNEIKNW